MEIQTRHDNHMAIITITGRFYPNLIHQFFQVISEQLAAGYACLIIDLKQIDFLNSVGIKAIIQAADLARHQGGDLHIANARKNVFYTLKLAGIDKFVNVHPCTIGTMSAYIPDRYSINEAAHLISICGR